MNLEGKYNTKIPAVKRLMREACELKEATEDYNASPLDENLFEWHFTVRGAQSTEFEGGVYHGRIIFPNEYPMKPPNIILLTPNGRFEVNKKICLSISGHHPETWQPSWSIRTALLALIAFMPSEARGTIASLDYTPEERRLLALKSQQWKCSECGPIAELLGNNNSNISQAESQMIKSVTFKADTMGPSKVDSSSSTPPQPTSLPTTDSARFNQEHQRNSSEEQQAIDPSGFSLDRTTADCLIAFIVIALAFLIYRRIF